jgi:hypothetical protein
MMLIVSRGFPVSFNHGSNQLYHDIFSKSEGASTPQKVQIFYGFSPPQYPAGWLVPFPSSATRYLNVHTHCPVETPVYFQYLGLSRETKLLLRRDRTISITFNIDIVTTYVSTIFFWIE